MLNPKLMPMLKLTPRPNMVMDMDMANTAKRLLKKLLTMYLFLLQLISLSRLPSLCPKKVCVDKPISLPVVQCDDIVEQKCIKVPSVKDDSVTVSKCIAQLAEPKCETRDLSLPKQVCVELVYGHASAY